jgi:FtsP/CotA-like multicopper oxidase with cupredoxin domain
VAINVDITLNRYLDHDPEGRMYVLAEELTRVRAEEAANARARAADPATAEPAVSLGLQADAIQPLTLRVRPGECLEVHLDDDLVEDEPASVHIHGSALTVASTGAAATAANGDAVARPGHPVTYEWMVGRDEPEATHYFHSHGDTRVQTSHGLFGAVVVEPPGSRWFDPLTGKERPTGWMSMVEAPGHEAFREFVLTYHELGDETFQPLDRNDLLVPQVDPITHIYRPDGRALNYRSEPFLNRLSLQQARGEPVDESLEYSSYSYGDPATPILRTYLGDRVKQRIVHGGSEVFHVHHVHGGGIRWRQQFGVEPASRVHGLDKHPPLRPQVSERTDSSSIGPSETFDLENECGAGGCQQSAGDFMFHCHVTEHYFAGMWGIWRTYNTLQDGPSSTDDLPPLRPLPTAPDGVPAVVPAVTSDRLVGTTVDWAGELRTVDDVVGWVRGQLPPQGRPGPYDASVHDWTMDGVIALGEPETAESWPAYRPRAPGVRPPILFDPRTGKPAYPFLRPHLLARPPFAPGHGPAPFLDPTADGRAPPAPGASGPASLCPTGSKVRSIPINAVAAPIVQNHKANLVDGRGQLYVRRDERDRVLAEEARRRPLTIRTNAGEDCLDVLYRSELVDSADDPFNKSGLHIHFMQFDVQASDGVDLGFNFEQTVRPYALASRPLLRAVRSGATELAVDDADGLRPGAAIGIGMEKDATFEVGVIAAIDGTTVRLADRLAFDHGAGELVSNEFVRYRWYPDVQFGTAFFHDHVNVPFSGRHGLYGAVIAEPPGSTWHDPRSGEVLASGPVADIRSAAPLAPGIDGSFRELVLGLQDDNDLSHVGRSTGSAVSLRVEPLDDRRSGADDPSQIFSSAIYGDPETPMLEAYLGDPFAVRTFVGGNNEVHSLHLDGHLVRTMPFDKGSTLTNNVHLGISERKDLFVPAAGGYQRKPGDYLWYDGRTLKLREGSWGLVRVLGPDDPQGTLERLPGYEAPVPPASDICPPVAPRRRFEVVAIDVALPMLGGKEGKVFVVAAERDAVASGRRAATPLVLRVDVGDCVEVELTNATSAGPVSFHVDRLSSDPQSSAGVSAGRNDPQSVTPAGSRTYELYASPEAGEGTAMIRDFGDVLTNPGLGLYGAIVVGPAGARYLDPMTGDPVTSRSGWRVDVEPAGGAKAPWRDAVLFLQDEDEAIGNHKMPYTTSVDGAAAINYQQAPLAPRLNETRDPAAVFRADGLAGPPSTPRIDVRVGDPVRIHVLSPWSEQAQVFSIEGHEWPTTSRDSGPLTSSAALVGLDVLDLDLRGGGGGVAGLPGDYVYGNHREPYREAGQWGILRVFACDERGDGPTPLPGSGCGPSTSAPLAGFATGLASGAGALGICTFLVVRRSRRRRAQAPGPT